ATEHVPPDEDVLEDGHRAEQVDVLERPGDAPPHDLVRRGAQQGRAVQLDLAGIRRVEPRDHVEHRGLARAVRADQAGHDAPVDVEGDAVQSHDAAEPQRDVPHREQHRARILEARCDEGRAGAGYGRRGALRSERPAAPARSRAPAATKAAVTSRGRSSRPTRDPRPAYTFSSAPAPSASKDSAPVYSAIAPSVSRSGGTGITCSCPGGPARIVPPSVPRAIVETGITAWCRRAAPCPGLRRPRV